MANSIFLEIDTAKGESQDKNHKDTIECMSMSWGTSNLSSVGTGTTGHGSGNANVSEINLMTLNSKASPELFAHCVKGTHFATITVYIVKSDGNDTYDFQKLILTNAYIASWQQSNSGNDIPTESISISFGKIEMVYKPQATADGSAGGDIVHSFDVETHSAS